MTKIFQEKQKTQLGPFWALVKILAKTNFSGKKGLCQCLNILIIYHSGKNLRKMSN